MNKQEKERAHAMAINNVLILQSLVNVRAIMDARIDNEKDIQKITDDSMTLYQFLSSAVGIAVDMSMEDLKEKRIGAREAKHIMTMTEMEFKPEPETI